MPLSTLFKAAALTLVGLASSGAAAAQQLPAEPAPAAPKNVLKIAPLGFIHGQLPFTVESRLGYERVLGPHSSVAGAYSYLGSNKAFNFLGSIALSAAITTAFTAAGHPTVVWTETRVRSKGHRYQLQYRRYLGRERYAPQGLYFSPHFSYAAAEYNVRLKDFEVTRIFKTTNSNYNLLLGYQKILGRHFLFDAFVGLGYRDIETKSYDENGVYLADMPEGIPLKISSSLNLGWAF